MGCSAGGIGRHRARARPYRRGYRPDDRKKINKDIKDQKLKVKVTIEADKLRVSSASKDALQTVIQFLRDQDYGQPLQFTNYR